MNFDSIIEIYKRREIVFYMTVRQYTHDTYQKCLSLLNLCEKDLRQSLSSLSKLGDESCLSEDDKMGNLILTDVNTSMFERLVEALLLIEELCLQGDNPAKISREFADSVLQDCYKFECKFTNDKRCVFQIPLLPKKSKRNTFSKALSVVWYRAVEHFKEKNNLHEFAVEQTIIQFIHVYRCETATHLIRDNDNYEYKPFIDMLTDSFLIPDNGILCHQHYASYLSDEIPNGTYCLLSNQELPLIKLDDLISIWQH